MKGNTLKNWASKFLVMASLEAIQRREANASIFFTALNHSIKIYNGNVKARGVTSNVFVAWEEMK